MELLKTLKKYGGLNLLKSYWNSGAFFSSVCELFVLGKNRTALEIVKLSARLKAKQKIEKKYRIVLEKFDDSWIEREHKKNSKIWFCWFQGIENAPELVKKCYESLQKNLGEVELITYDNMYTYVTFPDYIQNKIDLGIISGAHLSDLLRLELLIKYGGTWIDSTVYCSGENIPYYMLDSKLFMFQCLKPGRTGHAISISNWFITGYSNNKMLTATQTLLYEYWKDNDELVDYFIFHIFFEMVIEKYLDDWKKVIPFSNDVPHILLLRLFDTYDKNVWEAVTRICPFHKLSYKLDKQKLEYDNTFYKRIIQL